MACCWPSARVDALKVLRSRGGEVAHVDLVLSLLVWSMSRRVEGLEVAAGRCKNGECACLGFG